MKKETVIAIIAGCGFGIILSLFLIASTKEKRFEITKTLTKETKITPTVVKQASAIVSLEISSPEDGLITDKKTVSIKGKTEKKSLIIIQTALSDIIIKNEKEEFSTEIPLALGENLIHITSYSGEKEIQTQEKELRVYSIEE